MKTSKLLFLVLILFVSHNASSQIVIGGGVGVSLDVNIPFPDIVIGKRRPSPPVHVPREPRPVIVNDCGSCGYPEPRPVYRPRPVVVNTCNTCNDGYGQINNQNSGNGNYVYQVVGANVSSLGNGKEHVTYNLDTGEVLELVIQTANPNDYNYHYNNHVCNHRCNCNYNNTIISVVLNGRELPLRDGSLSLQPRHGGFHSVVNLHSLYEGDFNGTVNM